MLSKALWTGVLVLFCASLEAATYHISPTGNDAAAGTTIGSPLKTFVVAISKLKPGDSLILLDGTYDVSNSGYPFIRKLNGTAAQPITFKAQNERKAHIHNNGDANSIYVDSSSYLSFDGLQLSSADNANFKYPNSRGQGMAVNNCHHLILKKMLVHHNNRYGNVGLITMITVRNCLFEDCEFYYTHRHAITVKSSSRNTFRRIYCNSRGYGAIPDGAGNGHGSIGGDDVIALYPAKTSIVENCIGEGHMGCLVAIPAVDTADSNRILGSAIIDPSIGLNFYARSEVPSTAYTINSMPKNNVVENFVSLNAELDGARFLSAKGQHLINATLLNSTGNGVKVSYSGNATAGLYGDGKYSFFGDNILTVNSKQIGVLVNSMIQEWKINHANSFGNTPGNYDPVTSTNYTVSLSIDPKLGTCKMWIPDSSPMKRAGKNGADIGANILYRYQDGVLTSLPLWDPATGAFPHGAIVAGVNDIPGQSLYDVHKRLNVNCNNCPFPAGYPKPGTSAISTAYAVTNTGQAFLSTTPNFASLSLSVKTDADHPATVEIYNLQGKKIKKLRNVNGNSVQWQRGNQPAGVYFVKASSRGITATAKAVIGE